VQSRSAQSGHDLATIRHRYRRARGRWGAMMGRFLHSWSWCACLLACFWTLALPAEAQQSKIRVTLQLPITDALLGRSLARFEEEVERRSGKAIDVEIFDKGRLYIDDETVAAVASGKIEMGIAGFNQFAKQIPGIDIMEQPFLFNFEELVRATASPGSPMRTLIDKTILDTVGVRVLWWQSVGNQIFISKGTLPDEPGQIKGQKIRVFSPTHAQFVKYCGGTPVMVSANKTGDAFASREIDMATGASSLIANRQLWTVADTITRTLHAPIEFFLIVNERVWQSLPEAHKTVIVEAARAEERQSRENVAKIEAGLYAEFQEKGMTVHDLTPDQVADWRACSASIVEAYMANNAELARQLMAAYGRLRTDPCCTAGPSTGGTFSRR
jgi:C4-dicarboxylate-binding protein DctP